MVGPRICTSKRVQTTCSVNDANPLAPIGHAATNYYQIWEERGAVVERSAMLGSHDLPRVWWRDGGAGMPRRCSPTGVTVASPASAFRCDMPTRQMQDNRRRVQAFRRQASNACA